jgi:hypothetical protein
MADYTARAIIGVTIPDEDDLPRASVSVRKRAFKHDYDDDGENEFHPKDGRKLWLDEKETVKEDYPAFLFDSEDYYGDSLEKGQKLIKIPKSLTLVNGTDGCNRCLGFVVSTGNSNGGDETGFELIPDIAKIKADIKGLLEPLDLWDESIFGLHDLLYCSY